VRSTLCTALLFALGATPALAGAPQERVRQTVDGVSAVVNATKHTLRHAVLHASVIDAATVLLADVWTGVDRAMVRRSPLQSVTELAPRPSIAIA